MRNKLVKESLLEFHQTGDPLDSLNVGKNAYILDELKEKGIRINLWDLTGAEKDRILKNIDKLLLYIEKLYELGTPYSSMEISHHYSINVKYWKVLESNTVIAQCLTEEDAKNVIKVLPNLIIPRSSNANSFTYEFEEYTTYLYDNEVSDKWLENLENWRIKIKSIL